MNAISAGQWPGRHFRCIVRKGNAILERGSTSNTIIVKGNIRKFWSFSWKFYSSLLFIVFFFLSKEKKKLECRRSGQGRRFSVTGKHDTWREKKRRDTCIKETCKARNEVLQVLRNDRKTINPSLSLFNVISLIFSPRFIHTIIKYKFDIAIKKIQVLILILLYLLSILVIPYIHILLLFLNFNYKRWQEDTRNLIPIETEFLKTS